jgi:hypothetical protein
MLMIVSSLGSHVWFNAGGTVVANNRKDASCHILSVLESEFNVKRLMNLLLLCCSLKVLIED